MTTETTTPVPPAPARAPRAQRPAWVTPVAAATAGILAGSLFAGLIVNANAQARVDHCVGALDTSGEAMYAAGEAIEAAGTFDINGLETAATTIDGLNSSTFQEDVAECRGNA